MYLTPKIQRECIKIQGAHGPHCSSEKHFLATKDHTGWLKVANFSRTSDISSLNEQNYKLT